MFATGVGGMTAEIAILNRTAVALAADSIVTLAGPRGSKTYDSAEKIFELSRHQPIALMIYNNAQFMNAPLEVVVRRFRETLTTGQISELVQVWPAFEKFLLEFKRDAIDEHEHLHAMAWKELKELQTHLVNHMLRSLTGSPRTQGGAETELRRRIDERRKRAEADPLDDFLAEVTLEEFSRVYGEALEGIVDQALPGTGVTLSDDIHAEFRAMMFAIVKSRLRTPAFTGFVFAGFGHKELFPTLHALDCDGVYFGKFRILQTQFIDIDRRGQTAAVVPFAQKDMPERFIFGIDREFEAGIEQLATSVVGNIIDQSPRTYRSGKGDSIKAAAAKTFREGLERLKEKSELGLKSVVNHLSKKELGEVAYSLVELTSRKRRYSTEVETVGGPIDVAVLTRNEGFIWVRRKHYFDPEMNPAYFAKLRNERRG